MQFSTPTSARRFRRRHARHATSARSQHEALARARTRVPSMHTVDTQGSSTRDFACLVLLLFLLVG
eukprot:14417358-Alexandrium_andersonii.AAC.1